MTGKTPSKGEATINGADELSDQESASDDITSDDDLSDDMDEPDNSEEEFEGDDGEAVGGKEKGPLTSKRKGVEDNQPALPAKKRKQQKEDSNFVPPTNEELHQLKEAENLFHSSLFRLQLQELLKEIQLKKSTKKITDEALLMLKPFLMKLPAGEEYDLNDKKSLKTFSRKLGVRVPLNLKPPLVKGKFCFHPPSEVKVTGSYLLDTCLRSDTRVDLVLQMPKKCFQPKDHLNHRYLRKQALYLATLASHLKTSTFISSLKFTYHHGNHFRPILALCVKAGNSKTVAVNIHAVPEPGVFKLNRFTINKNNVRRRWFSGTSSPSEEDDADPPTPYYNSSVLQDITMLSHLSHLYSALGESPGVRDGVCLLKVWLRQRELIQGRGAFTGFLLSMYVSYLLAIKKLNKLMSSYQVVRSTLLHLSLSDWTTEPLTLNSNLSDPHCPMPTEFYQHFDVVFVDPSGYLNLCADWTKDMFFRVKHEALQGLRALDDFTVDGFEVLFMHRISFLHKFDYSFHLRDLDLKAAVSHVGLETRELDRGGNPLSVCLPALLELLYKALGQRVQLIQLQRQPPVQWGIEEEIPSTDSTAVTIGLLLNPEHASSVVERGPAADSIAAKEFREFWGERSEIRRFQDGGICEAVLWPGKSIAAKRLTPAAIVKHVLHRHAKIGKACVSYIGGQLDEVLVGGLSEDTSTTAHTLSTGEEAHMAVMAVYSELCKELRTFRDLPLNITSIQGTSPVFRFTEVYPASPCSPAMAAPGTDVCLPDPAKPAPQWTPAFTVVCLLEGSGKWPEDGEAIRRLKAAFYIKLAQLLKGEGLKVKVHPDNVEILKEGYVFRLRLAYLHELAVLRTLRTPEGMVQLRDTAQSLALERNVVALPKLTSMLHGIQQQHNTFGAVSRLVKRWIAAHLLSDFFLEEAIELIVAHLYISPAPLTSPSSPLCGFLRFLKLMASFDWRTSPLLVNLKQEFTKEKVSEIQSRFSQHRAEFPVMSVITPQDKTASPWTQEAPPPQVLHRVTLLARESLTVLETQLIQAGLVTDFKQIFRPPLALYHMLIHLRPKNLPRRHQAVDLTAKMKQRQHLIEGEQEGFPVVEFDPCRFYVDELKEAYGEMGLFFHDKYGGNLVGVLWKPDTFKSQPFKVTEMKGRMVEPNTSSQAKVSTVPNLEAVMEDMRLIGGGLVDRIEVQADNFS